MPNVSLFAGEATPANVVLRSFPLPAPAAVPYDVVLFVESPAPILAPPVISPVLFAGDASPSTVILRPLVIAARTLGPVNVILRVAGAAVGPAIIHATLVSTLADATLAGTGTVSGAGGTITGTLSQLLADATLSSTGTVLISGALARTLADATLSSTGTVRISGTLAQTLADATLSAFGTNLVTGTLSRTLADATLAGLGTVASDATGFDVFHMINPIYRIVPTYGISRSIKVGANMTVKIPVVFGRKVVIAPANRRLIV